MKKLLVCFALLAGCNAPAVEPLPQKWNLNLEVQAIKYQLQELTKGTVSYDYQGTFTVHLPLSKGSPTRSEIVEIVKRFDKSSTARLKYAYHIETVEEAVQFRGWCAKQFLDDIDFLKEHNK